MVRTFLKILALVAVSAAPFRLQGQSSATGAPQAPAVRPPAMASVNPALLNGLRYRLVGP